MATPALNSPSSLPLPIPPPGTPPRIRHPSSTSTLTSTPPRVSTPPKRVSTPPIPIPHQWAIAGEIRRKIDVLEGLWRECCAGDSDGDGEFDWAGRDEWDVWLM
ncbi:hypothetical protein BDK51DRAFT_34385, partial [Blyttiomyces helicus]